MCAHIAKASVFVFVYIDNGDARENNENCICLLEKVTILALWPYICPVIQAVYFDPINFSYQKLNRSITKHVLHSNVNRESSVSWKCSERNICSFIRFFFSFFFFAIWQLLYKIDMHELSTVLSERKKMQRNQQQQQEMTW